MPVTESPLHKAHVLFVESNRSGFGRSLIDYALDIGCTVTFASHNPEYFLHPGERAPDSFLARCHKVLVMDTHNDLDTLYQNLTDYCAIDNVTAVIATSDAEVVQAACIAQRAGLFGTAPAAVQAANLKHLTREYLTAAAVAQPRYRTAVCAASAVTAARELGYPCVVKAVDASDSMSVTLAGCDHDVELAFADHFRTDMYSRDVRKLDVMLIEEYIAGPLYSVEVLACDGRYTVLGVTDRVLSQPPVFVELGAGFPITGTDADALTATALAALRAIGFDNGPAHVELVLAADGPKIIEINPRIIGNSIPDVIAHCLNIDIRRILLELYLGHGIEPHYPADKAGYTLSIVADTPGRLRRIEVPDLPDGVEVHLKDKIGTVVQVPRTNQDRLGRIVAYGTTVDQARQRAQAIHAQINMEIG